MSKGLIGVSDSRSQRTLNRYTIPGAIRTAVSRYETAINGQQQAAVKGMEQGLTRYPQNGLENTFHTDMMTDVYNVGLSGAEAPWTSMLSVFTGEIGKGIGGRLSGQNPYVTTTNTVNAPAPAAPKKPSWVMPAVIGGAVLVIGGLFFALRK